MAPDHPSPHQISRRRALALGALAGGTVLAGDAVDALAATRTRELVVTPDEFGGRGGVSAVLRARGAFVLLGVRDPGAAGARLEVRARRSRGRWTPWTALHDHSGHAPDSGPGRPASDPVWTGAADELQLRASRRPRRPLHVVLVAVGAAARGVLAARTAAATTAAAHHAHGAQLGAQPPIVARAAWGGDRVTPRAAPSLGSVDIAIVHHTENANTYAQADSPAIVLAIARYHRDTKGWNDVGYNFLVDRYGTIFEGRAGGVSLPVIGAHAQGFNRFSTGISIIGSFTGEPAPAPALAAVAQLIAWKLPLHGTPVSGLVELVSGGGALTQHPYGSKVVFDRISGHRDADSTDCPGNQLYAQLPALRRSVGAIAPQVPITPTVSLGAPASVRFGTGARFSGELTDASKTPLPGREVALEKQSPSGAWRAIARAVTGADGSFSLTTTWTRAGIVRATALEVSSLPVSVGIVPALSATLSATTVAAGSPVVVSGSIRPAQGGQLILERRGARGWTRVAVSRVRGRPAFSQPVALVRPGSYRITLRVVRGGRPVRTAPLLVRAT